MHLLVLSILAILLFAFTGWWAATRHQHQKRETEIRRLKENLKEEIQKTCKAASSGDRDAAMKMKALESNIEAQSVRLTGRPKPPTTVLKGGIQELQG